MTQWRLEIDLCPQREAEDDGAREQDHEDGRPVARIGEFQIEPADLAARRQGEKTVEQPPLAAPRASPASPVAEGDCGG